MRWAIEVVWSDGESEFLRRGLSPDGPVATFNARSRAEEQAAFMQEGMDDVQSVNVVKAPGGAK